MDNLSSHSVHSVYSMHSATSMHSTQSHNSSHSLSSLSSRASSIRSILITADDEELMYDLDNFEDSRIELSATSHNLTSVLINPRETFLENFLDDFAQEQSAPLDYYPLANFTSPSNEAEQLKKLIDRLSKSQKFYKLLHATVKARNAPTPRSSITDDILTCFREVPDIFFHSDFNLRNPTTFELVLGSTNLDVQDKLSHYLDLVELALLKLIWSRSPSFFRALDDINGLQKKVAEASSQTVSLRQSLRSFDNIASQSPMRISRLEVRRRNLKTTYSVLLHMQAVIQGASVIENLIQVEDVLGAMQVLSHTRNQVTTAMSSLSCMHALLQHLNQYDDHIKDVMSIRFVNMAIEYDDFNDDNNSNDDRRSSVTSNTSKNNTNNGHPSYQTRPDTSVSEGLSLDLLVQKDDLATSMDVVMSCQQESFRLLVKVLFESNRLSGALQSYHTRLMHSIRLIVRTCVLEYLSGFDPGSGGGTSTSGDWMVEEADSDTPFTQRVKSMGNEHFLSCLSMSYEHILIALHRSVAIHEQISVVIARSIRNNSYDNKCNTDTDTEVQDSFERVSQSAGVSPSNGGTGRGDSPALGLANTSHSTMQSLSGATKEALDSSHALVLAACDLAQKSISQLISLRRDSIIRLGLDKTKFLWEISLFFILAIEDISKATAYVLRQCLLNHAKLFLENLAETTKTKLITTLDAEKWVQCEVSNERQKEIHRIISGKSFLPNDKISNENNSNLNNKMPGSTSTNMPNGVDNGTIDSKQKKKELSPVAIENSNYRVVWSVLLLVEVLGQYLDISINFSPLTIDVITKVVDILRLFDTRTKQLVLGAQAIQSTARLKSIAAKHLCVTSQSLGLVIAILPHIRATLLTQLPSKHHILLTELDRVFHAVIEHHSQILSKFVTIVGDFVDASAGKLRAMDWDKFPTLPQHSTSNTSVPSTSGQCEYFEDVLKNVTALHRVLLSTLPVDQVHDVFSRIFALLNRKIFHHFESIEQLPTTQAGRQRILDEISHLVNACTLLKHVDATSLTLEETFKAKFSTSNVVGKDSNTSSSDVGDGNVVVGIHSGTSNSALLLPIADESDTVSTSAATTMTS